MSTPESSQSHPIWEGAVLGFLGIVEQRAVQQEAVIQRMGQLCAELIQSQWLPDLGQLQGYLRGRDAAVQLIAQPFYPGTFGPDITCVDLATREPRSHWLMVSVGAAEAAVQLQRLGNSDEVNEMLLAHDTGMLSLSSPD